MGRENRFIEIKASFELGSRLEFKALRFIFTYSLTSKALWTAGGFGLDAVLLTGIESQLSPP